MKRRDFITLVGGAVAAWPIPARAQQGERVRRIGVLFSMAADDPLIQARYRRIPAGLTGIGLDDRPQCANRARWATTAADVRKYAAELVALAPDVILANGGPVVTQCCR